jgi:16S rRNA A1518/A1519 N6-dimethyltransferase RsmA/KsgA/DIM1 with predicted DNA glycosylase/AP lyase activity
VPDLEPELAALHDDCAICAEGSQFRAMTVIAHFFSQPQYKFRIDRSCYFPSPRVHGALATFTLHPVEQRPEVQSVREFLSFARQAFSSKRKMMANSLQPSWNKEDVYVALDNLCLPVTVRFDLLWMYTTVVICSLPVWHTGGGMMRCLQRSSFT